MLPIYGITPFSMIDYPQKISSIIWFSGCNFKCSYCYNTELVKEKIKRLPSTKVFEFLKDRQGLIDAVVISGGECTLYNIYDFVKKIKELNFNVKIDTNGSNPQLIKKLIDDNLIDYIALDYKAPSYKFNEVIQTGINFDLFKETLNLLIHSNINYETRTTLCPNLVQEKEVSNIVDELNNVFHYSKTYYIQNYRFEHLEKDYNIGLKNKIQEQITGKNLGFQVEYRNF
jgi:pyruvate formate lyase activating enzyme